MFTFVTADPVPLRRRDHHPFRAVFLIGVAVVLVFGFWLGLRS